MERHSKARISPYLAVLDYSLALVKYRLQDSNIWFDRNHKGSLHLMWEALESSRRTRQYSHSDIDVKKLPLLPQYDKSSSPKVTDRSSTWELAPEAHRLLFQSYKLTRTKQTSLCTGRPMVVFLPFYQKHKLTASTSGLGHTSKTAELESMRNMHVCDATHGTSGATGTLFVYRGKHLWNLTTLFVVTAEKAGVGSYTYRMLLPGSWTTGAVAF